MSGTKASRKLSNNAFQAAENANNPSASNPFITEVESAVGSASLLLYPTSAASAIPTYSKLVNTISDPDYDDPAVDSSTGAINATGQLIAEFASEEGVISGNPGVVNVNTIGNIRRVSGTGTATFYFEVYIRDNGGTETLIGTSNTTGASSNAVYEQYFASCLINATSFGPTDRVVTKWYANRLPGGSDPTYEIQLGGATPVKITFPVPFVNLPSTVEELNDLTDVTTGLPSSPTNADDGRVLYYDVDTNQWISDDIANISNVVKDCKTSVLTGSIPKGTPVYLAGYDNDLLVVEPCDAASSATMPCIGITAEALDDTNAKKVVSFGKIQGFDTSLWADGTELYVAVGGGFTTTRPTGTAEIQRIAVVLKGLSAVGGSIKVFNTSRTAGLPNITELYDWVGDSNGHPVERRNQVEPFLTGSSPTVNTDETLGYRRGSMVFDFSQVPTRLWICLNPATGAAVWEVVNNDVINFWGAISLAADAGFTWGSGTLNPLSYGDGLQLVAGTNVTIETDTAQDAVRISATGGGTNSFETVGLSPDIGFTWGTNDVVADSATDTLKLVAGSNITLETDDVNDGVRISATGGGGSAKFNHTTYAFDFVGASGTWNGNTVGAVGSTEYDDRWRVAIFSGTGQADGFYINFRLSSEYTAGTDIRVEFDFATLVGSGGGNAHFGVGLCEPETVNNSFGSEATTTYITQDIAVQPGDRIATYSATFSGTNLEPGDQLSVMVYRDPGNAGDTSNETLYVSTIQVEEV